MKDTKIHILVGDITTVDTEVIVNAANHRLLGGGGVDGAIHKVGGPQILDECKNIRATAYPDGLPAGKAVITKAGNLKSKYIVHAIGPNYRFDSSPELSLESCYRNSLLLADEYKCKSIAFPSISTGIYAYPKHEASKIAYKTIKRTLVDCQFIEYVVFVFYSQDDANIMERII